MIELLKHGAFPDTADIELNLLVKVYSKVWPELIVESNLLKLCNERAVSTRIVVRAPLRQNVFRALHKTAHHGYEETLRRIAQQFWWPHVRADCFLGESNRAKCAIETKCQIRFRTSHLDICRRIN